MLSMRTEPTLAKTLADKVLETPVEPWIAEQRAAGKSWRRIATDLRKRSGDELDLHPQTVERWLREAGIADPAKQVA